MIRKLEVLVPPFLKRINQYLLVNHPVVWATKVHYVLFYSLVTLAGILLMSFIQVDIRDLGEPERKFLFMMIPAVIGFLLWGYHTAQFSIERGFGHLSTGDKLKQQAIYAICIGLFASFPYVAGYMTGYFNANRVSDQTLVEDANVINLVWANLYTESNPHFRSSNSFPTWAPVNVYAGSTEQLKGKDLIRTWKGLSENEKVTLITKSQQLVQKYNHSPYYEENPGQLLYLAESNAYDNAGLKNYFSGVKRNIEDIDRAKRLFASGNYDFFDSNVVPFSVFTFSLLWLVLMLFIRTGPRKFWISIITGTAMIIAGSLISAIGDSVLDIDFEYLAGMLFFGTWIFLIMFSFARKNSRRLNLWKSVGLALAASATPFLFIIWEETFDHYTRLSDEFLLYGGVIVLFISWNLVFSNRFTYLQSAPQQD